MDKAFQKALAAGESLDAVKSKLEGKAKAEEQEKLRRINSDFSMARLINYILMTEPKASESYRVAKTLLNQYRKATGQDKADRENKKLLKSIQQAMTDDEKETKEGGCNGKSEKEIKADKPIPRSEESQS